MYSILSLNVDRDIGQRPLLQVSLRIQSENSQLRIQSDNSQLGTLSQELNNLIFRNLEQATSPRQYYLPQLDDNHSETKSATNNDEIEVIQRITLPEANIPTVEELCQRAVSSTNSLPINFQQSLPFISKFLRETNQLLILPIS